jgi:hypothetical protein
MQRAVFGPRRKERTGGSRKLYEELYSVYTLHSTVCNNQIKDSTGGYVANMTDIKTFIEHSIKDIRKEGNIHKA